VSILGYLSSFALYPQSRSSELFQTDIHPAAQLGRGISLDHATGLVVGATAVIEDDVSILQDVTLGGTGKHSGDRLAEPAALMRDDAEQMLGFGPFRIEVKQAPTKRLGLRQPAFVAVALGKHESLGQRHECRCVPRSRDLAHARPDTMRPRILPRAA